MKETVFVSLLIWIITINIGKVWPTSKGERYYQNLQRWYMLANKGEWSKAKKIETRLKSEDIDNFKKENEKEELEKRYQILETRNQKNADDWMEIAVLLYKLNQKDDAYKAIEKAHNLDPIREDISKIYFTYQTFR
jgi:tetratricopeptide (TPR) repeat protein